MIAHSIRFQRFEAERSKNVLKIPVVFITTCVLFLLMFNFLALVTHFPIIPDLLW
jgi:hypothetical protein